MGGVPLSRGEEVKQKRKVGIQRLPETFDIIKNVLSLMRVSQKFFS
jgi:hypothetical protein